MQLIEKVSTLSEKFYAIDMAHFEEDVEKTLLGLGFERSDLIVLQVNSLEVGVCASNLLNSC